MQKHLILLLIIFSILHIYNLPSANAEYCATGKFEGEVCKGFVIESCKSVTIDAVKGNDGQLYTLKKCYSSVSEYNPSTQRCWINSKSKGWGILSVAINTAKQPVFLHKEPSGKYEVVDAEYVTFNCVQE